MTPSKLALIVVCSTLLPAGAPLHSQELNSTFARDPGQPINQQYTDQIRKYTTDPSFISPLVDYLPASTHKCRPRQHVSICPVVCPK